MQAYVSFLLRFLAESLRIQNSSDKSCTVFSLFPFDEQGINATGALLEKENISANVNNIVIYFTSEDCITEEVRVEKAGGKIIRPRISIGKFGFIFLFLDIDRNTIGLHSRK